MRQTVVIGNVFVDIKGNAFRSVHKDAKNVGQIQFVHGGVARNVVHNLAVLGDECRFVATVNQGALGDEVVSALQNLGVDTTYIDSYPSQGMGTWLAVLEPNGDLLASISEQPSLSQQEDTILGAMPECISHASLMGLDVGISERVNQEVIRACQRAGVPVFGVVGNLDVVEKQPYSLAGLDTFVCNAEEAAMLAGFPIQSVEAAQDGAQKIREFGCERIVITLAAQGSVVFTADKSYFTPAEKVQLVDSTGAGDSFFAGLLFAVKNGAALQEAARFASEVAARVVSSAHNTLVKTPG